MTTQPAPTRISPLVPNRVKRKRHQWLGTPGRSRAGSPPARSADPSIPSNPAERPHRNRVRRLLEPKIGRIAAVAVLAPVMGLSLGLATSTSASVAQTASSRAGSNARSGPAAGGASGTVGGVSKSGFTLTTSAGQKVTVDEEASTKYLKRDQLDLEERRDQGQARPRTRNHQWNHHQGHPGHRADIQRIGYFLGRKGDRLPARRTDHVEASRTVPGQLDARVGDHRQRNGRQQGDRGGAGGLPGGVVDRVVKLSDGDYNVHYIGVNWPHHVFLNQDFKVIGAE